MESDPAAGREEAYVFGGAFIKSLVLIRAG